MRSLFVISLCTGAYATCSIAGAPTCAVDSIHKRILTTAVGKFPGQATGLTVQGCLQMCADRNFTIAGTEYGDECYCASKLAFAPVVSDACTMACAGDRAATCGGLDAIAVYASFRCSGTPSPTPPPPPTPPPTPPTPPPPALYPHTRPCELVPLQGTPACDPSLDAEARIKDLIARIPAAERPNLFSYKATGVPSLNIPFYNWGSEALHGVGKCPYRTAFPPAVANGTCCYDVPDPRYAQGSGRTVHKCPTSFPAGITTMCSFNTTLIRAIGSAIGTEARVASNIGVASLTFWTPNVNVREQFFLRLLLPLPFLFLLLPAAAPLHPAAALWLR